MKGKVVVFGGGGFLGSHIADELSDNDYNVIVFDIKTSPWLRNDQQMIVGDILDEESVRQAIQGADYVYHLAGIADIGQAAEDPLETIKRNVLGTTLILDACVAAGVARFVFASTVYVYSQHGSFYRASKQSAENIIEAYCEKFGLEFTILRYGSLYGPRSQEWNGLRRYVKEAVTARKICYRGTGEERREYIHVSDAAKLSISILSPSYRNSCLMLTGTQVLTSRELAKMIQEIIGSDVQIEFVPDERDHHHYVMTPYRYSPRQAKKVISESFVDIGEGILSLVEEVHLFEENKK